jgi:hypothetical protein
MYLRVLQTEFLKIKRSVVLWLTLIYPLGTVFLISLFLYGDNNLPDNPWLTFCKHLNDTASFFIPFYIVLITGYICFNEHKSNTLKHIYAQPISRFNLFIGKISIIFILLFITFILFILLAYLAGFILNFVSSRLPFKLNSLPFQHFLTIFTRTYLSCFLIVVFQHWLSFRLKNLVLPIAIGIILIILPIGILMVLGITRLISDPKLFKYVFEYDPFTYPFSSIFQFKPGEKIAEEGIFTSLRVLYFILSLILLAFSYLGSA